MGKSQADGAQARGCVEAGGVEGEEEGGDEGEDQRVRFSFVISVFLVVCLL